MSNTKRIFTLILAVITCMSICLINIGAEWRDFYGTSVTYDMFPNDDNNDSEASASISNWGYNEEDNDLVATTWAHAGYNSDYTAIMAVAGLSITFDDYSGGGGDTYSRWGYGESWIDAYHEGYQYDDFDHCVIGFTTSHEVYVMEYINGVLVPGQHGASFYIGTSS